MSFASRIAATVDHAEPSSALFPQVTNSSASSLSPVAGRESCPESALAEIRAKAGPAQGRHIAGIVTAAAEEEKRRTGGMRVMRAALRAGLSCGGGQAGRRQP